MADRREVMEKLQTLVEYKPPHDNDLERIKVNQAIIAEALIKLLWKP